jgi:hypothetical protein
MDVRPGEPRREREEIGVRTGLGHGATTPASR